MSTPNDPSRVALDGLRRAITPGPDDLDHLSPAVLDALALGTLGEVDRETADEHLAGCEQCTEDLADRRAIQVAIDAAASIPVAGTRPRGPRLVVLGFAAAAAVVLAVSVARRTDGPAPSATVASGVGAPKASRSDDGGRVPVESDGPDGEARLAGEAALVARVLAHGRLELPPDAVELAGTVGTLLGAGDRAAMFRPMAPLGTAVLEVRPRFAWQATPGATGYTVRVYDDRFQGVAEGQVAGTTWVPPLDLARGFTYSWQVTAHRPEGDLTVPVPPQPEARFRVVTAAVAEETARQRRRLAGDPLTLGILLAQSGLVSEADAVLATAATSPEHRSTVTRLRGTLPSGALR